MFHIVPRISLRFQAGFDAAEGRKKDDTETGNRKGKLNLFRAVQLSSQGGARLCRGFGRKRPTSSAEISRV